MAATQGMSQGLFLPCQQRPREFLGEAAGLSCQGGSVNETLPELLLPFLLPRPPQAGRGVTEQGTGCQEGGV